MCPRRQALCLAELPRHHRAGEEIDPTGPAGGAAGVGRSLGVPGGAALLPSAPPSQSRHLPTLGVEHWLLGTGWGSVRPGPGAGTAPRPLTLRGLQGGQQTSPRPWAPLLCMTSLALTSSAVRRTDFSLCSCRNRGGSESFFLSLPGGERVG